ncbi:MAG: cysteine desulfurase family protein [Thermoguttaceae bacterium]
MPIYFDNNATTPVAPEVVTAMEPYFRDVYFNPSSAYEPAKAAKHAIESAREEVASLIGASSPREIVWVSCATESVNAALFGVARAQPQRRHIVTTAVEHPAVLEVCRELQRNGYEVTFLGVNRQGELNIGDFVRALRTDTLCVSIMHANNETGVVFPIERLARLTKETNPHISFHCDATQSVTKLPINLSENFRHVDLLSFSGHKFHAPKGVGALYLRRGTPCRPFILGGHQESGRRGGTENVAFIVGMARAMTLAANNHDAEIAYITALRDRLERGLLERTSFLEINGGSAPRTPGTLNVACHSVEGESILYLLNDAGICASSGSACTSGSLEPSHVLTAMGVPFTAMHGSVRFSLSRYNTDAEVDSVLETFPQVIAQLRRASPFWDDANECPR